MLKYRENIYSQNGEDGILAETFKRLKIKDGKACEFGAADGYWLSNIRALMNKGWEGIQFEAKDGQVITPENVNEIVPINLDLLSIDIDGNDYDVWKAYKGMPDVVVIEINSSLDPSIDQFSPVTGANFSIMLKLAKSKGYFLLCHTGNLIFVLKKHKRLFPEAKGTDIDKFLNDWIQ